MSLPTPGQTSTPPSDFKLIFEAALSKYEEKTGKRLLDYPLATEVQGCDSVDAILDILQGKAKEFQQFRDGGQRLMKWISPSVHVLFTFSATLSEGVAFAYPPAKAIFVGIGVLLGAAKAVGASHDTLVELFERIESFFGRLKVYTQLSSITEIAGVLKEVLVKIVAEVLSVLSIATKEVKRKRAKIYFRNLLGKTDIEDAMKRLTNLVQEEARMAIVQTMKTVIEHRDDAKKANAVIANKIGEIRWNQIEQDVRKWFSPPDPSTNYNTACGVYRNVPPTWFFGAGVFKDWMSNGTLLWVHGKPGSGKSILCSAIIQYIMKLRDVGTATLGYFYFDFRDEEKRNVRNLVTSLLVQLSAYSKPCCDIIYRLYSVHGNGIQQPRNDILMNCLKAMLTAAAQHPIFVIMDALDECPHSGMRTPREEVLDLVRDLVRLHLPNLRICVTSRSEIDIPTKLKPLAVNEISLHDQSRQKIVIADYIRSVVSSDEQMKQWREEDKKLVVDELSQRADGMFQWVSCQLETLRHAVQPNVRGILKKLPRTLDETYRRMLENIHESNRAHASRLLHCLANSVRPLRVEELAEILKFDFDTAGGGIPKFHPDRRSNNQEADILSICSSLVAIVDDRGSRVVQFSHQSVKEFLTSTSSTGDLSLYHILPRRAHTILAQVCLGLLLHLDNTNDNKSVKGSPLVEYATRHWVTHVQFENVASRVEDGMKSLFDPDKPHFAAWIGLYDIDAESGVRLPSEIPNPLYYSVLYGLHDLVRDIAVKHPQQVNAIGGSYGFPLVAALCRNNFQVADLLLEHGGRVDVRDTREQTALHKTIDRDDNVTIDAVRFLLEHGANVDAQRDDLWTPLHQAVNSGKLSVAWMLLEHKANANLRNNDGQAPLHLLSRRDISQDEGDDSSDIAKLLLERGANVDEKDKDNANPLHLASYYKRLEIVRVLLDHGANADAEKDRGETPLQMLLKGDHNAQEDGIDVARLLLKHGAEVYARDKYHISPSDLARCLKFGKEKIWQVPLGGEKLKPENKRDRTAFQSWIEECGVDGNVQDKYDTILLHSASFHGRQEMAQILLNHGVKSNTKNHRGETALHVVSRGSHGSQDGVRVAQLLLDHGVDANTQRKDHWTPLHLASYYGKHEIVQMLLGHRANATAMTDKGWTPLHVVSRGEYQSKEDGARVARLLLDHHVDVNARLKDHCTPLHVASYFGKVEVARVLLNEGAKANAMNDWGRTPLHQVSQGKFESQADGVRVAQLLLDHGVDVNAQDKSGATALHLASWCGELEIVQVLLQVGHATKSDRVHSLSHVGLEERTVDLNVQQKEHETPLHFASFQGRQEIARLLLGRGAEPNARNGQGETPLHRVSYGNYKSQEDGVRIAQLLLKYGVYVDAQRDKDHCTPLHLASYFGKPEIAQLLLDHDAKPNARNDKGETPLHNVSCGNYGSQEDGVRVVLLLLKRGVSVNVPSDNYWTPLHLASYFGKPEIAQVLLDRGADVNAKTNLGGTPLHTVTYGKYESEEDGVRVAQLLLGRGAEVNAQRNDRWTPLHLASYFGRLEIARTLLDRGAKVDAVDGLGLSPLHNVSQGAYEAGVGVARLLLEHGADVNARATSGETPLDLISDRSSKLAELLLEYAANVNAQRPRTSSSRADYYQ